MKRQEMAVRSLWLSAGAAGMVVLTRASAYHYGESKALTIGTLLAAASLLCGVRLQLLLWRKT